MESESYGNDLGAVKVNPMLEEYKSNIPFIVFLFICVLNTLHCTYLFHVITLPIV